MTITAADIRREVKEKKCYIFTLDVLRYRWDIEKRRNPSN